MIASQGNVSLTAYNFLFNNMKKSEMNEWVGIVKSVDGEVEGSRLDWELMHPLCCNSFFQIPLSLVARLRGVQMGSLRWLSLFGHFQMPQCVQFWWREAQSPTVLPDFTRPCLIEFVFRNISKRSWESINLVPRLIITCSLLALLKSNLHRQTSGWS